MATPKKPASTPSLEKREERVGRDLDHDGEKGESAAHRANVLGNKGEKEIPSGGLRKTKTKTKTKTSKKKGA